MLNAKDLNLLNAPERCHHYALDSSVGFVIPFLITLSIGLLSGCDSIGGSETKPPSPPSAVEATGADGVVQLSWDAPEENVKGYRVYRDTNEGFTVSEESTPITGESSLSETSFEDTGVTNADTYYYRVTAVNEGGESESSSLAAATPMASPPDRP